jgi:hypothetical protein
MIPKNAMHLQQGTQAPELRKNYPFMTFINYYMLNNIN